jgi:AcrR family transcriptional regulator
MDTEKKRQYRSAEETKKHVLDVAARLFYAEGIHAVGIDGLAEAAQVTTATLYRLFGSKEGLIAAYLRRSDQEWFEWLERAVAAGGLPQLFDEIDQKARDCDCRGCAFRMALAEYPSPQSEVHCVAVESKRRTHFRFRELAREAGATDSDATAAQLMLILDGIWASASERTSDSPPGPGPDLVRSVLSFAVPSAT